MGIESAVIRDLFKEMEGAAPGHDATVRRVIAGNDMTRRLLEDTLTPAHDELLG